MLYIVCLMLGALVGFLCSCLLTSGKLADKDFIIESQRRFIAKLIRQLREAHEEETIIIEYDYKCKTPGQCEGQCCYICSVAGECKKSNRCKGTPLMCGLSVKDGEVK